MRVLFVLPLFFLAACQGLAPAQEVGGAAWMERVDRQLGVSDGQGHGPDYGSQEWCNVVHFRLHGQHAATPVPCDRAWMQEVDRMLPSQ
ncbi:hypothetical protein [Alcaligenes sp. SDU_A2]|uniref:hypothetical protein n=1 Tax=Alcaligenes sp. SDU_A2 TaxID=3136634 RepID=UPI00311E2EBC